jgi:hypothetical protein
MVGDIFELVRFCNTLFRQAFEITGVRSSEAA